MAFLEEKNKWVISLKNSEISIRKNDGLISSIKINGKEVLSPRLGGIEISLKRMFVSTMLVEKVYGLEKIEKILDNSPIVSSKKYEDNGNLIFEFTKNNKIEKYNISQKLKFFDEFFEWNVDVEDFSGKARMISINYILPIIENADKWKLWCPTAQKIIELISHKQYICYFRHSPNYPL